MQHWTTEHRRERVGTVFEPRDDAEVSSAPANRPEEVRFRVFARRDDVTGGENHLRGQEIVERDPVLGHQPAEPTTDSEARYPGAGDLTAGRGETECRCGAVEFAPDNPGLRS